MITQENNNLLNEVYRAAKMGQHAINAVLPKVTNIQLRDKIESQYDAYSRIATKSGRMLRSNNAEPEKTSLMQRIGLWSSVQMNTLTDNSTSHIAEMMIQGSTMGITDMTKKLSELDEADAGARELAEEYIGCEQKHIESMKKYL